MKKPPKTPPHSDLDGVAEDERDNVDAAIKLGQDSGDLARAKDKSVGRPRPAEGEESRDDRTR